MGMKKSSIALLVALPVSMSGGYFLNDLVEPEPLVVSMEQESDEFHDLRTNTIESFPALIDPVDPEVVKLAKKFKTLEEAYNFVSDEIQFVPYAPSGPVAGTLNHRMGSCIGKAVLLCSIYQAMGVPSKNVRIIMGIVATPGGYADHVWIDMEANGKCLQQDPSGMLGRFAFADFPGRRYSETYAVKETFCFNDTSFAVVSQLNGMRTN